MEKQTVAFTCRIKASLPSGQLFMKQVGMTISNNAPGEILLDMETEDSPIDILDEKNLECFVVDVSSKRYNIAPMRLKCALHPARYATMEGGNYACAILLVNNNIKLAPENLRKVLRVWPTSMVFDFTQIQ